MLVVHIISVRFCCKAFHLRFDNNIVIIIKEYNVRILNSLKIK